MPRGGAPDESDFIGFQPKHRYKLRLYKQPFDTSIFNETRGQLSRALQIQCQIIEPTLKKVDIPP